MSQLARYLIYPLSERVIDLNLSTLDVDLNSPEIAGHSIIFYILTRLYASERSMFIVANDVRKSIHYINGLSLLLDDPNRLEKIIDFSDREFSNFIKRIRFYEFDMYHIIRTTDNNYSEWQEFMKWLAAKKEEAVFIIKNLNFLYSHKDSKKKQKRASELFFNTRTMRQFIFIAPLSWLDYSQHIEFGTFQMLIEHRAPVLLDPRPPDLPTYPIEHLSPDSIHKFV